MTKQTNLRDLREKLFEQAIVKARSNFAKTDPIKKTRNISSVAGELKYMPPGGNTFGMLKAEFPFNDVSGFESPKIMASINYNMAAREKKKPKKLWGFKNKRTPKPLAYGGNTPVANTPEMSRRGLNDLNYDEMYFPGNGERRRKFTMGGMKDSIYYEGLDDYNNVVESGIKHPGDEDWVIDAPNVYEKRINNNSSSKRKAKKKIKSFAELLAEHNNKENTV